MCKITMGKSIPTAEKNTQSIDTDTKSSKLIKQKRKKPKIGAEETRKIPRFKGALKAKYDKKAQPEKVDSFRQGIK